MTEPKRRPGRPSINAVAPKITVPADLHNQILALAAERDEKVSPLYQQALALALPAMMRWRRYTLSECEGLKYADDVEINPDKYPDVRFPDNDLLAAGFNPADFGDLGYSVLVKKFREHAKGSRVIIDHRRDKFDVAIERRPPSSPR